MFVNVRRTQNKDKRHLVAKQVIDKILLSKSYPAYIASIKFIHTIQDVLKILDACIMSETIPERMSLQGQW